MTKRWTYPVDLSPDDDTILVGFPDFPEAHTFGEDKDEALARAVDCLETILEAYMSDRLDIPTPSPAGRRPTIRLPALSEAKVALYHTMREQGVGKAELARRLACHLPQVDRLLDLGHASRLDQLERALAALGKRLAIELEEIA